MDHGEEALVVGSHAALVRDGAGEEGLLLVGLLCDEEIGAEEGRSG
jgi:hypothetical protein